MNTWAWLRDAALTGAAGAVGFAGVYAAILLLRRFGESAPGLGYLPQFLLYLTLTAAVAFGAALPGRMLGAEWLLGLLGSLGSHLLWLMAVYATLIYIDIPNPNAMVLVLAGGFVVMLLVSEQSYVPTWWLVVLGVVLAGAGAAVWLAPLPGYLTAGLTWALMPLLGSLIIDVNDAR